MRWSGGCVLQELMIDLLDCLMAMGFRERAREEGEARMKYKRRGRWEGYSVWLALGNGPIMAGTHCPAYERGYGVRASVTSQPAPSYPLVPLSSPESLVRPHSYLRLPASQCVGTGRQVPCLGHSVDLCPQRCMLLAQEGTCIVP